jgi:hypothetical protein
MEGECRSLGYGLRGSAWIKLYLTDMGEYITDAHYFLTEAFQ